jgi:RNA polymerase sigma-70 factor (ECF subfamily)
VRPYIDSKDKLMLEENELIERVKKGEPSAFEGLYKKYASSMRFVCQRYAKTTFEVEDIFQEAFMKVFTNINKYKGNGSFDGWIKRIFINTAIDHYRKRHGQELEYFDCLSHDVTDDDPEPDDIEKMAEVLTNEKILELIDLLPAGYKMVFNLFIVEGYGHKEIGCVLGITEGTSKSQLMKAKKYLRSNITSYLEQKKNEGLKRFFNNRLSFN